MASVRTTGVLVILFRLFALSTIASWPRSGKLRCFHDERCAVLYHALDRASSCRRLGTKQLVYEHLNSLLSPAMSRTKCDAVPLSISTGNEIVVELNERSLTRTILLFRKLEPAITLRTGSEAVRRSAQQSEEGTAYHWKVKPRRCNGDRFPKPAIN
jgi:hypothetical protein